MTTERTKAGRSAAVGERELQALADLFAVLGDLTRVRLLHALSGGERCVGELGVRLGVSPSAVSHQLQLLRAARLVRYRRAGREVFYALDDAHVEALIRLGLEHLAE